MGTLDGVVTEDGRAVRSVVPTARLGDIIPLTVTSHGVTLCIDREGDSYIECPIEHCGFARTAFIEIARKYDLYLDDDPYYDEMQADGSLRTYLLEVTPD